MAEKLVLEFIGKDEITKTSKGIISSLGGIGTIAAGAATAGLALAAGAAVGLGAALVSSIGAAMEAQEGQAQLAAVLESTGGVAGVTAEMANALASEYQSLTRFEDDVVLSGENMLLTFTNIGKDVFPLATQTMLDMSQALGQDVTQSAMQLGKALNDPVQGVTALKRVGVEFTDAQTAMIAKMVETGDVAGAQGIILQELQREFGGSAVAAGQTFAGQLDRLKNTFGDVKETIGAAFLPILSELAEALLSGLNSPEFQAILQGLSDFITNTLVPAISTLVGWFMDKVVPALREAYNQISAALGPAIRELWGALQNLAGALGLNTGKIDVLNIVFDVLKVGLEIIVGIARTAADVFRGVASGIEAISNAIKYVVNKFKEMKKAAEDAVNAIPDWLTPGSPTPFELGLRGIGKAMQNVNVQMGSGFAPALASPGTAVGGGGGGGPIIVNLTYAPAVSLADRYEAEQKLVPYIQAALRRVT